MMKRRLVSQLYLSSLILAALMLFGSCSQKGPVATSVSSAGETAESTGETGDSSLAKTGSEAEKVSLRIAWNEAAQSTADKTDWPTRIAEEVFAKTGVTFEIDGMDDEKFSVLLAGGDLPDMVFLNGNSFVNQLIEGKHVIELDGLVQSNGPEVLARHESRLDFNREFAGKDGKLFFLSVNAGPNSPAFSLDMGYVVRWDYYKELGYPEIKDEMDLLDAVAEMQKAHPETDDGKTVYGMGYFTDWSGLWSYRINLFREGFAELSDPGYLYATSDSSLKQNYIETDSPLWRTAQFMYQANGMGLLDPDSFTMKQADYSAKAVEGQYLTNSTLWFIQDFNAEEIKRDPNSDRGYVCIPVEGSSSWNNGETKAGWYKFWGITKNCQTPEKAMDLINYFYSEDGVRTNYAGIKGEHWDVDESGKAYIFPETIEMMNTGSNPEVGFGEFTNFCGSYGGTVFSDGVVADLTATPEVLKLRVTGVYKDYCEYYQVDYPDQAIGKMVNEGKMTDGSVGNGDIAAVMAQPPDDIKRIDAKMLEIFTRSLPVLVLSEDDEMFETNKQALLDELKDAGSETSAEWWRQALAEAVTATTKF